MNSFSVNLGTKNKAQTNYMDIAFCLPSSLVTYCRYVDRQENVFLKMGHKETPVSHKNSLTIEILFFPLSLSWAEFIFVETDGQINNENAVLIPGDGMMYHFTDIPENKENILLICTKNTSLCASDVSIATRNIWQTDQSLDWNSTFEYGMVRAFMLVAVSRKMDELSVDLLQNEICKNFTFIYQWVTIKIATENKLLSSNGCTTQGCLIPKLTSFGTFFFAQFVRNGCHHYSDVCVFAHFSWNKALGFCMKQKMFLPELLSRGEQEDLLALLKMSHDLHLIEALYIGLRSTTSNRVKHTALAHCLPC